MPEIQVDWHSRQEADRLRDLRDRHGMVWRGVLLEGAKHTESIDLLKALTELHPALAKTLPGPSRHEPEGQSRSAIAEELREQIRERQRVRETTEIPLSAFDGDSDADSDRDTHPPADTEQRPASDRAPASEHREPQSVAFDATRARTYEQWDVQEARAIEDGELLHPHPAHEDVQDILHQEAGHSDHPEEDELDEWKLYDDYLYDYDGEY